MSRMTDLSAALGHPHPEAMRVDDVQAFLSQLVAPLVPTQNEHIALRDALGRVLADDIVSPLNVPPHDNSAMDGYAFDGALLDPPAEAAADADADADAAADAVLSLPVVGTALAGRGWCDAAPPAGAVRIMTGAMMPPGLDTVVPQELCTVEGSRVRFPTNVLQRGSNRRLAGEDLMQGQPALRRGERLSPAALGMVASLGLPKVQVVRRLRVACFSTGDEILSLGERPRAGAVYDSNRYTLIGLLTQLDCEVVELGVVGDNPVALTEALRRGASQADVIVTSGGVSAGEADHTRAVLAGLGDVAFWGIAMRPGRPMAVGLIPRNLPPGPDAGAALLFGLPGNPVAAMVTFLAFVRPALLQMMGCHAAAAAAPPWLRARAAGPIRKKAGRTEYQRGHVRSLRGQLPEVRLAGRQGSGVLSSMVEANGLVVLHHEQGDVAAGDEVDVMMFGGLM